MDKADIIPGIIVAVILCGFAILLAAIGFIVIILAIYASAYTIALFHILFVEPVIFDTYSLFTVPYNEIWAIANMYQMFLWILAALYIIGFIEGISNKKCK